MKKYTLKKILLIEDNLNDVEFSLRALKKNQIDKNIVIINDGEEALNYLFHKGKYSKIDFENETPTVVLLDMNLPKVSGLEILRSMRTNEELKSVPVIALTSCQEDQAIIEAYNLGVNGYIVKPGNFDKFVKAFSILRKIGFLGNI